MAALSPSRWLHDKRLIAEHPVIIGVDEVGRGCLAGPVVAGAVELNRAFFQSRMRRAAALEFRDSKQLTAKRREALHKTIEDWCSEGSIRLAIASASVEEIDRLNILGANTLAMRRALSELLGESVGPTRILVDGRPVKHLGYDHRAIVKGDDTSLAIAIASVAAKVFRDRLMAELATSFPHYGFEENAGYRTDKHREGLKRHGPCKHHRYLFKQKIFGTEPAYRQNEFSLSTE